VRQKIGEQRRQNDVRQSDVRRKKGEQRRNDVRQNKGEQRHEKCRRREKGRRRENLGHAGIAGRGVWSVSV